MPINVGEPFVYFGELRVYSVELRVEIPL